MIIEFQEKFLINQGVIIMYKNCKQVKIYRSDLSNINTTESDEYLYSIIDYDTNGNLLSTEIFSINNTLKEKITNTYNPDGKLIEEIATHAPDNLTQRLTIEYNNNTKTEKTFYEDGSFQKSISTFNNNNIINKVEHFDNEDSLIETEIFEYRDNNLLVSQKCIDCNDNIIDEKSYEYDNNNNLIRENSYENNELVSSTKYTYDNNLLISVEYYENELLLSTVKYEYNNQKLPINITARESDNIIKVVQNKYDEHENLIEESTNDLLYNLSHKIKRDFCSKNKVISEKYSSSYSEEGNYCLRYEYFEFN